MSEFIGVFGLSSCDYSIPAMTDGKPSCTHVSGGVTTVIVPEGSIVAGS